MKRPESSVYAVSLSSYNAPQHNSRDVFYLGALPDTLHILFSFTRHVFENNLMETDEDKLLDPEIINDIVFPEAQSVAFFETRLWLHGSFESPSNLLTRVDQLVGVPIWICQGHFDEVCPPQYAQKFADALQEVGAEFTLRSIPSGHEQTGSERQVLAAFRQQ